MIYELTSLVIPGMFTEIMERIVREERQSRKAHSYEMTSEL